MMRINRSTLSQRNTTRRVYLACILAAWLSLACLTQPVLAGFATTGDIAPADPNTWTSGTYAYIGQTSDGTLAINDGSTVGSNRGYIAHDGNSTG